jgi:hypothetical protein
MSALGHTYRIRASNTQNQAITVVVKARAWKFASDGSLTFASESTPISSTSLSASTGTTTSSTIDNSSDKYLGMNITASFTAASATNGSGTVALFLERSTDGGTTWPTAGQGVMIGAYTVTAANGTSTILVNFTVR